MKTMYKRIYLSHAFMPACLFFFFAIFNVANTLYTTDAPKIINVAAAIGVLLLFTGILLFIIGYLLLRRYKELFSGSYSTEEFNRRFRSKVNVHIRFAMYYSLIIYTSAPFLYGIAQFIQGYGSVIDLGVSAHSLISCLGFGVIVTSLNYMYFRKSVIRLGELQGFTAPNLLS